MITIEEKKELVKETVLCAIRTFKDRGKYPYLARMFRGNKPSLYRELFTCISRRRNILYEVETLDDLVQTLLTHGRSENFFDIVKITVNEDETKAKYLYRQFLVNDIVNQLMIYVVNPFEPIDTINEMGEEIMKNVATKLQSIGDLSLLDDLMKSLLSKNNLYITS